MTSPKEDIREQKLNTYMDCHIASYQMFVASFNLVPREEILLVFSVVSILRARLNILRRMRVNNTDIESQLLSQ